MNLPQPSNRIGLMTICLLLGVGCAAQPTPAVQPATATPVPPTASPAATQTELKYLLFARYPNFFFCDPDFYPIARGDEQQAALQRFPEIQTNVEVYQAILRHLNLQGDNLSDAQKLLIYRDYKKLNALPLQPAGDAYTFQLRTADNNRNGTAVEGTISNQGAINITKTQPTIVTCPICLSAGTLIDTPAGPVPVEALTSGTTVWTLDEQGARVAAAIIRTARVPVPAAHEMVRVRLDDGREVVASPGHPTADGRALGQLLGGDWLDGARVASVSRELYRNDATYDILPDGSTGTYWANGILLGSTLARYSAAP